MKTLTSLCLLVLLTGCIAVSAQPTITLMTFESYTFSDQFDTQYGYGEVGDGFQWGGGLEFGLSETTAIELIYQTMKTDAMYQGFDPNNILGKTYRGNIGVHYIMLGGTRYAPLNDRISGFGTLNMGVGWFTPDASLEAESQARFSLGGKLGVRIKATEKVSLRIHGQVFSPVQWAGGGFYFGSGGSGAGVTTGSTIWQFNVGGSLNFRLK
ncbi:MAG TPA: hypothetical protein PLJ60_02385 [Chryseolinea sp.]|nr:hypothetical protein [Chryseolinea sp.]